MSLNTETLREAVIRWYEKDHNRILKLQRIVCNTDGSMPSLREIEYAVMNYAKKTIVQYDVRRGNEVKAFNLYYSYQTYMKSTPDGKDNFDMFARGEKFMFHGMETSVCQLNFFRWMLQNDVITWIMQNREMIQRDMKPTLERRRSERKFGLGKKELNPKNPYKCVSLPRSSPIASTQANPQP